MRSTAAIRGKFREYAGQRRGEAEGERVIAGVDKGKKQTTRGERGSYNSRQPRNETPFALHFPGSRGDTEAELNTRRP